MASKRVRPSSSGATRNEEKPDPCEVKQTEKISGKEYIQERNKLMTYPSNMAKFAILTVCALDVCGAFAQSYDPHNPNPTQWDVHQAQNAARQHEQQALQEGLNGNLLNAQLQQQKAWEANRTVHSFEDRMRQQQQEQQQERQKQQQNLFNQGTYNIIPSDQQFLQEAAAIASLERNEPYPQKYCNWRISDSASLRSSYKQLAKTKFTGFFETWCNSMHSNHMGGFDRKGKESKIRDAKTWFDMYAADYDNGWFQIGSPDPSSYQKWDKSRFIIHYENFSMCSSFPEIAVMHSRFGAATSLKNYRLFKSYRDKLCAERYSERQKFRKAALKLWGQEWNK